MSILADLFSTTTRPGPLDDYWYGPFQPLDGSVKVTASSALTVSTVWRGLSVLGNTLGMVPLEVERRLPNGQGKERDREHRLYKALHRGPNRWQTSLNWRQTGMIHAVLNGDFYNRIIRGRDGFEVQLRPMPSHQVCPIDQRGNGDLVYEFSPINGDKEILSGGVDIQHIHGVSLDNVRGVPLLDLMKRGVESTINRENFLLRFFKQSPTMKGFLQYAKRLTPEQRSSYEDSFAKAHAAADQWHRAVVLENGMDWKPAGISNEDSQMIESGMFQVEEFARYIGVPAVLLMHADKTSTYASAEQFFQSFLTYDIAHWFVAWEQALERDLLTEAERDTHTITFNLEGLLRGDAKSRADFYKVMIELDVFTRNEVRVLEGKNKREGLDESPPTMATPPPSTPPDQLAAIAQASAHRLVRKEVAAVRKIYDRYGEASADHLREFYQKFSSDVALGMAMPIPQAVTYCLVREKMASPAVLDEWEENAGAELADMIGVSTC